ncbi:MAG: hypothetical protein ACI9C4_001950 [Paraglaciecola sp.]|jgi:hypothetical protein
MIIIPDFKGILIDAVIANMMLVSRYYSLRFIRVGSEVMSCHLVVSVVALALNRKKMGWLHHRVSDIGYGRRALERTYNTQVSTLIDPK